MIRPKGAIQDAAKTAKKLDWMGTLDNELKMGKKLIISTPARHSPAFGEGADRFALDSALEKVIKDAKKKPREEIVQKEDFVQESKDVGQLTHRPTAIVAPSVARKRVHAAMQRCYPREGSRHLKSSIKMRAGVGTSVETMGRDGVALPQKIIRKTMKKKTRKKPR